MVVNSLLQHESGWQLGPNYCHSAVWNLQLEDDPVSIWIDLCGSLLRLSAGHQEWAQGCGAAQYRSSGQEEQRRWDWDFYHMIYDRSSGTGFSHCSSHIVAEWIRHTCFNSRLTQNCALSRCVCVCFCTACAFCVVTKGQWLGGLCTQCAPHMPPVWVVHRQIESSCEEMLHVALNLLSISTSVTATLYHNHLVIWMLVFQIHGEKVVIVGFSVCFLFRSLQ